MLRLARIILPVTIALSATAALAQGQDRGGDLRSAVQNPISSLISLPFKFTFDNGAPNGDANTLSINPVYPVTFGNVNLISRALIPLADAPGGVAGLPSNPAIGQVDRGNSRAQGLGDINYTLFASPVEPVNGWTWGFGPSVTFPTATSNQLGSGKWSAGLSAVALNQPGWGTFGALVRHLWSFAGESDRWGVNQTLFEPFINYNLDNGWYLISDSVITYDWALKDDDGLLLPVGGGFGKLFRIGNQAMNARAEVYYNVVRPDSAPEWTIGFTVQLLFPKG